MDKDLRQTIVGGLNDEVRGNCMQATIASLFDMKIEDVPNFIEYNEKWFDVMYNFVREQGYEILGTLYNWRRWELETDEPISETAKNDRFNEIKEMNGVNGFFYASVLSPKYYSKENLPHACHAVVIDKDFNIVNPINSEYDGMTKFPEHEHLGYNGIVDILMIEKIE